MFLHMVCVLARDGARMLTGFCCKSGYMWSQEIPDCRHGSPKRAVETTVYSKNSTVSVILSHCAGYGVAFCESRALQELFFGSGAAEAFEGGHGGSVLRVFVSLLTLSPREALFASFVFFPHEAASDKVALLEKQVEELRMNRASADKEALYCHGGVTRKPHR
eukprot:1945009-Amphidinium_carterae.1